MKINTVINSIHDELSRLTNLIIELDGGREMTQIEKSDRTILTSKQLSGELDFISERICGQVSALTSITRKKKS